ncbi:hypothetical protein BAUCODRAFT_301986 [Baudoinia panamericana UAMH 10762]|uniref:Uncharacterized protein n=1 Tax=Baudoinia panamericana (strain UAMH 10762) TaxID=717646 RepID=M2MK59_BAUPA|nr:uncharacterized protein BAUCODRAFT_301986 [Baudoinia panamericana UAMH 10762]EMC91713.1 hypothetical protein BAUCODRAFT_301986 [Baudoinia panamericana UAMH 10762]
MNTHSQLVAMLLAATDHKKPLSINFQRHHQRHCKRYWLKNGPRSPLPPQQRAKLDRQRTRLLLALCSSIDLALLPDKQDHINQNGPRRRNPSRPQHPGAPRAHPYQPRPHHFPPQPPRKPLLPHHHHEHHPPPALHPQTHHALRRLPRPQPPRLTRRHPLRNQHPHSPPRPTRLHVLQSGHRPIHPSPTRTLETTNPVLPPPKHRPHIPTQPSHRLPQTSHGDYEVSQKRLLLHLQPSRPWCSHRTALPLPRRSAQHAHGQLQEYDSRAAGCRRRGTPLALGSLRRHRHAQGYFRPRGVAQVCGGIHGWENSYAWGGEGEDFEQVWWR